MTVADVERSVVLLNVLSFEKVLDFEVVGSAYEQLQGVFGLGMRVVRMRLGGGNGRPKAEDRLTSKIPMVTTGDPAVPTGERRSEGQAKTDRLFLGMI